MKYGRSQRSQYEKKMLFICIETKSKNWMSEVGFAIDLSITLLTDSQEKIKQREKTKEFL